MLSIAEIKRFIDDDSSSEKKKFAKGEEKGHFEFGGSTVIVLINQELEINEKILENSRNEIETIVKLGQYIGK